MGEFLQNEKEGLKDFENEYYNNVIFPKVSIIIPVYNVEKYLNKCLDSVVNQTLKDIEIICINDGSTDSSLRILEEYASKDNRIKIINKENSGYGASMNRGLKESTGDYIGIVESDDYVENRMFETLYQTAIENSCDLVRCRYYKWNSKENINELQDNNDVVLNEVYCPLDDTQPFKQAPAIWSNLVKRSLIEENGISFLETPGASYQDTSFAFKLYATSKRFMKINDALLHYRIDNENSSVKSKAKANFILTEYAEIKRFAIEKGVYDRLKTLIQKIKYNSYRWNHRRLAPLLKFPFLLEWQKEYFKDLINGTFERDKYSRKEWKKIIIISLCPILYIFNRSI